MAIDSAMGPGGAVDLIPTSYPQESVVLDDDPRVSDNGTLIEDTEDGGMLIDFDPNAPLAEEDLFSVNLANKLGEGDLSDISNELVNKFNMDKSSRSDWEKTYKEGVDLLGLSVEDRTEPWAGASGVTHPILTEAVVRFQSQAIGEIFPEGGPCKTKLVGESSVKKTAHGARVEHHMNWMVTEEIEEYREETDRLLFHLPVAGSAFKKVFDDPDDGTIHATFIPAEDIVVNAGCTSLKTASRVSEIMRKDGNWIAKRKRAGFYAGIDLQQTDSQRSELKDKLRGTIGEEYSSADDDMFTLIEVHCDLDLSEQSGSDFDQGDSVALPYIVTIDLGSGGVLSIYRNWLPDDLNRKKRQHYTHYQYIPGFGFYGLGLLHLLGGIAKGSTSMLRQLIDAGTLNNLQAGYKTRGMRVKGENTPLAPGEFRDVDVPAGKISDNLFVLPFKEPSQVLFSLLGSLVEEGRRFASLTDISIGNMSQEAPVGTTLALIERNMKVMTAIQSRLHKSMKDEFTIMVKILQERPDKVYPYEVEGGSDQMQADFDNRIDIIPVSDPNSSTSAHRIMKAQAALQMYQMAPQLHNAKPLFRYALETMEIPGAKDIVPLEEDIKPMDPITENMAALTMEPIKAFMHQDHQAHIQVHMLGMQDPKVLSILQDSPGAQASAAAMMSHVTEHVAYQYRSEMEVSLGTQLPPEGEELPPEIEAEFSRLVAQASTKLFEKNMSEKQQVENEQKAEDPLTQIRMRELSLEETTEMAKIELQKARLELDKAKLVQKDESEGESRLQDALSNSEKVQGQIISNVVRAASETERLSSAERVKLFESLVDSIKTETQSIVEDRKGTAQIDDN